MRCLVLEAVCAELMPSCDEARIRRRGEVDVGREKVVMDYQARIVQYEIILHIMQPNAIFFEREPELPSKSIHV